MTIFLYYLLISLTWYTIVTISIISYKKDYGERIFKLCLLHGIFWPFSMIYNLICFVFDMQKR